MAGSRPWLAYLVAVVFIVIGLTFVLLSAHSSSGGAAAVVAGFGQGCAMLVAGVLLLFDHARADLVVFLVAVLTTAVSVLNGFDPIGLLFAVLVWLFHGWYKRWQREQL